MGWLKRVFPALGERRDLARLTVREARLLAIDLEMTGLEPKKDHILSFGWVAISGLEIDLSTARHVLVKSDASVGQSATIHGLRRCDCADGVPLKEALQTLLKAVEGRVPLFHHAGLDSAFLKQALATCQLAPWQKLALDTLKIERQRLQNRGEVIPAQRLSLEGCRDAYRLPSAPGHNALEDALATAELFLAQVAAMRNPALPDQSLTLGDLGL